MALVEVNLVVILFVRQVKAYVQITLWKLKAVKEVVFTSTGSTS